MKYVVIVSMLMLAACSSIKSDAKPNGEVQDFYLLLSGLLNVNQNEYVFTDSEGKETTDELRMYQELERIYITNIVPDLDSGVFSSDRLKVVMFFAFYAKESNAAAFQEALAENLMPIYLGNKTTFLRVLKELPFLAEANCERLNAYFGHEGKSETEKPRFVADNLKLFQQSLSSEQYSLCVKYF